MEKIKKEKKFDILMLFQLIFASLVLFLSIYSKVTQNYNSIPLLLILMSIMILIMGIREYKRKQSLFWGIFYLCISLFILFAAL